MPVNAAGSNAYVSKAPKSETAPIAVGPQREPRIAHRAHWA